MGVSGWSPGIGNALQFQFRRAGVFPGEHCAFTARVIRQLTGGGAGGGVRLPFSLQGFYKGLGKEVEFLPPRG